MHPIFSLALVRNPHRMLATITLQPANVLISSSGRVKLADFGIVSRQPPYDNEDGTVLHHTVIGTVRYMSPERLHGRPYTRSSDVWSVGLLLLEIVRGGCSPFEDVSSVVSHYVYFPTLHSFTVTIISNVTLQ